MRSRVIAPRRQTSERIGSQHWSLDTWILISVLEMTLSSSKMLFRRKSLPPPGAPPGDFRGLGDYSRRAAATFSRLSGTGTPGCPVPCRIQPGPPQYREHTGVMARSPQRLHPDLGQTADACSVGRSRLTRRHQRISWRGRRCRYHAAHHFVSQRARRAGPAGLGPCAAKGHGGQPAGAPSPGKPLPSRAGAVLPRSAGPAGLSNRAGCTFQRAGAADGARFLPIRFDHQRVARRGRVLQEAPGEFGIRTLARALSRASSRPRKIR